MTNLILVLLWFALVFYCATTMPPRLTWKEYFAGLSTHPRWWGASSIVLFPILIWWLDATSGN